MTSRRRLLSIGKTAVYLHPATALVAAYMVWQGKGLFLLIGMVSILLHEAAHALVSALFGQSPCEIEITPLGALMRLEDDDCMLPWQRLLVLLAGPAASFGLCWLSIAMTKVGMLPQHVGKLMFSSNLVLTALNLLPALPLDGGRLLALVLSVWLKPRMIGNIMRITGNVLGLGMISADVYLCFHLGTLNFSLCMTGCFLIYAACVGTTTHAMAELRMLMDRKIRLETRGGLRGEVIALTENTSLKTAMGYLTQRRYTLFCILQTGTMKLLGIVGEERLISAYLEAPSLLCREVLPSARKPE